MSGDKIPPIDPVTGKFVRPHDGKGIQDRDRTN